jgi:16S rRNA G527 N7-methylase RsmG
MNLAAQLTAGLRTLQVPAGEGEVAKLLAFQSLLTKWNAKYNLTAIREC